MAGASGARKRATGRGGWLGTLDRSIEHLVIAYCEDYDRRERALTAPETDDDTRDLYRHLNRAIDDALDTSLSSLAPDARVAMRQDIACRRGATYSPLYTLSPATYKRYKRRAKLHIARGLGLLPEA